jgi:hypothetical protein
MTEEKKSPNPFINMANANKQKQQLQSKNKTHNVPKSNKGFGKNSVVRRTGRGG